MKLLKTFWSARDELHNLCFFVKYTETRFQQCLSLFEVELRHYSNAVHLYLIGSHAKMFKLQSRKLWTV